MSRVEILAQRRDFEMESLGLGLDWGGIEDGL